MRLYYVLQRKFYIYLRVTLLKRSINQNVELSHPISPLPPFSFCLINSLLETNTRVT